MCFREASVVIVSVCLVGKGAGLFEPLSVDRGYDAVAESGAFFCAVCRLDVFQCSRNVDGVVCVVGVHAVWEPFGEHVTFSVVAGCECSCGGVHELGQVARGRVVSVCLGALAVVGFGDASVDVVFVGTFGGGSTPRNRSG